jgi:hypothetical protein
MRTRARAHTHTHTHTHTYTHTATVAATHTGGFRDNILPRHLAVLRGPDTDTQKIHRHTHTP